MDARSRIPKNKLVALSRKQRIALRKRWYNPQGYTRKKRRLDYERQCILATDGKLTWKQKYRLHYLRQQLGLTTNTKAFNKRESKKQREMLRKDFPDLFPTPLTISESKRVQ